ncbi:Nucleolar protein 16 [Coemansia helicoidea]|uniref:Nucleolar protein 16 n=1 Tax=Coemansia helicoidea TaxID=1286919 RepID=A0ACC1L8J6_9FUNG|nr:Nucleolar protein 16 [Coemansia helicoidea]
MVRPAARKKLRNPKLKVTRRRANNARKTRHAAHPLLREHWDPELTVSENYRKLGLVSRLNGVSGGTAFDVTAAASGGGEAAGPTIEPGMSEEEIKKAIPHGYGYIERDAEGNVVKVIVRDDEGISHDPLDSDYEVAPEAPKKEGARLLEQYALEYESRKETWISAGERRILQDFIDKHSDDYQAMFWDKQLNQQQLTARQIQKRIEAYLTEKAKALGPAPATR